MVSVWGRVISVSARDPWPVRYLRYPGSPSAALRAPPRSPGSPVFDPVTVSPGIGNLQLAPRSPLTVEIQPVPVISKWDHVFLPGNFERFSGEGCLVILDLNVLAFLGGRDGRRAIRPRAAARAGAPAGATARAGSPQASEDASARHQGETGGGRSMEASGRACNVYFCASPGIFA